MPRRKKKSLYFRSLKSVHESGFRNMEYGYCSIDNKNNAVDIEIVGKYDAFFWENVKLHIDLTRNGYFRILNDEYRWDSFFSGRLKKNSSQH